MRRFRIVLDNGLKNKIYFEMTIKRMIKWRNGIQLDQKMYEVGDLTAVGCKNCFQRDDGSKSPCDAVHDMAIITKIEEIS